jgi:hypothetical protein
MQTGGSVSDTFRQAARFHLRALRSRDTIAFMPTILFDGQLLNGRIVPIDCRRESRKDGNASALSRARIGGKTETKARRGDASEHGLVVVHARPGIIETRTDGNHQGQEMVFPRMRDTGSRRFGPARQLRFAFSRGTGGQCLLQPGVELL